MIIVITSSEFAELRNICNRIVIVVNGKAEGILPPDASNAEFGLMMSGVSNGSQQEDGEACL